MRVVANRLTVDFMELDGSPTETISADLWSGTGATRIFRCASEDRMQLIKEFLGYWTGAIYHLPHSYLDIAGIVVATNAATKPVGKITAQADNRFANYPKTDVTITYLIPPETFQAYGGLVTVTETMREASEFVTCASKGLYWYVDGVDNEPIDEFDAPGVVNDLVEWTYEIRRARVVPAGIWGYPGHVNSYQCYSRTFNLFFPAETLLCCTPEVSVERTFNGTTYNITLRFLSKNNGTLLGPRGWNHFPRRSELDATDVSWERMVTNKTGNVEKIFYPHADFRNIFVP